MHLKKTEGIICFSERSLNIITLAEVPGLWYISQRKLAQYKGPGFKEV